MTVLERVGVVQEARHLVEEHDRDVVVGEDGAQLVADEVDDRLELEFRGDALLDRVDHGQLTGALLGLAQEAFGLLEQQRALERHTDARSDRRQQSNLRVAVRMLAVEVLEVDAPDHRVASDDRHRHQRFRRLRAGENGCVGGHRADHDRCARRPHAVEGSTWSGRSRRHVESHAALVRVHVVQKAGRLVEPRDADVLDAERHAEAVADEVDDAGEVELCGDALLNRVDGGQFGGALFGLTQEALRLFEQSGVLQGHPDASGDRGQQARFVLTERVLSLMVLEVDRADDLVADNDRHPDERLGGIGSFDDRQPKRFHLGERAEDRGRRVRWSSSNGAAGGFRRQVEADAVLVHVHAVQQVRRSLEPHDPDVVGSQQHPELVAGQVDDRGERQTGRDPTLDGVDDAQHVTEMIVVRALLAAIRPVRHSGQMLAGQRPHWRGAVQKWGRNQVVLTGTWRGDRLEKARGAGDLCAARSRARGDTRP